MFLFTSTLAVGTANMPILRERKPGNRNLIYLLIYIQIHGQNKGEWRFQPRNYVSINYLRAKHELGTKHKIRNRKSYKLKANARVMTHRGWELVQ